MTNHLITAEFVLALEDQQLIETLTFTAPITLGDALPQFALYKKTIELIPKPVVGIFNQRVSDEYLLLDGDRIEVYRPLIIDPKTARQIRAKRKAKALRQVAQAAKNSLSSKTKPYSD